MSKEINLPVLTGSLLGQAFGKLAASRKYNDGCYVYFTKELADHLANIYEKTDWDRFDINDVNYLVELPEDIFGETIDMDKLYSHIGECVYLTVFGDPWEDVFSATAIPNGIQLDFMSRSLELALDILQENIVVDCQDEFIWELLKAVTMMAKSQNSEEVIRLRFENQMLKSLT